MHQIEPYANWLKYYDSSEDTQSPFFGKDYNYDLYTETIYGSQYSVIGDQWSV